MGTLVWDTTQDGLELRTGYLLVWEGGLFQLGREAVPMEKKAVIHIVKGPHEHHLLGYRFVGAYGRGARISIHGRRLARTWTLLSRTAKPGSTQLFLKHDPQAMGWRVGDRIGLATTSRGTSTQHVIENIGPATEWQLPIHSVSAGKEEPGHQASKAIDGSTSTYWSTNMAWRDSVGKLWIQFDLGGPSREPRYLTRLRVNWHPIRYAPVYTVQLLNGTAGDGATAESFNVTNGHGGWQEVNISQSASAIRIFVPDFDTLKLRCPPVAQADPWWAGLWLQEVEVFGREVGQPSPTVLHLKEPLTQEHWGGWQEIQGHRFEMAAEVVNLERSVLITGDHEDFYKTKQGLHTIMHGEGVMDVRYTRVEYCGQRHAMGRYCLHFHLTGQCPECTLQGNAVVDSQQVGITLHGTHRTLIDSNVIWDSRGAGIYVEDGNEMHNIMSNNAIICSWWKNCSVPWLVDAAYAGIYMVGMTNDLIGNRVAGYENGIWTEGSKFPHGQGVAAGRVCPQFTPFGTIRGNVNHDNERFGMYADNQYPRRVLRNDKGYISGGCGEFTETGEDNGLVPANVIEDEFDWHNQFVGQYSLGDISYVRYTSVNNAHSMYWKKSKNFADGVSHHIRDSVIANHPSLGYGALQIFGPGGPFTFLLSNITFLGGPVRRAAICAAQVCGQAGAGVPCNVQYLLEKVNFTGLDPGARHVKFGISGDSGYVTPLFLAPPNDTSLGGYQSIVSRHLTGFSNVSACEKTSWTHDWGYGCRTAVRQLNLWSTNVSTVHIQGEGYTQQPDWNRPVSGRNAGMMPFELPDGGGNGGYGMPVVLGNSYTILGQWRGDVVTEFSDPSLSRHFGDEAVNVSFEADGSRPCELRPEKQLFLGADGPVRGMPPIVRCVINKTQDFLDTTSFPPGGGSGGGTCTGRTNGSCSFPTPPQITYYWEPCCSRGKLGCHADGVNVECRLCGADAWSAVPCPSTTITTTPEAAFRFQLIKSGTCTSLGLAPIQSRSLCQDAASELGLSDTSATSIVRPDRPEGCYWHSSATLWLNTDPRAAGNGAETNSGADRYPICEKRHYRIVADGACGGRPWLPIATVQGCEEAAKALGLSDTVASVDRTHPDRPEGCYLFQDQYLWMGVHPDTVGKGAEQSAAGKRRHPICSKLWNASTVTATTSASLGAL